MASKTIIGSFVMLWVLTRLGIRRRPQSKIHHRGPHPLERGVPYYYQHFMHRNSVHQSRSSWWRARKFLDSMRTESPRSRTLALHAGGRLGVGIAKRKGGKREERKSTAP